jgi:hypothetical protein
MICTNATGDRLTTEVENPCCLSIHFAMNRHNHPALFGFAVLNQRGLDGLWIEGKSLLAVAAFQKFPGAGKWSGTGSLQKGQNTYCCWWKEVHRVSRVFRSHRRTSSATQESVAVNDCPPLLRIRRLRENVPLRHVAGTLEMPVIMKAEATAMQRDNLADTPFHRKQTAECSAQIFWNIWLPCSL